VQIHILEIKFSFNGKEDSLFPAVVRSENDTLLIDCGYAGFLPKLEDALLAIDLSFNDLTGIVITHHDIDHMGCLFEIKSRYPHLKIWSSDIEEPFISGRKKSLRLQQAEDSFDQLPEAYKEGAREFIAQLQSIEATAVDHSPVFRTSKLKLPIR